MKGWVNPWIATVSENHELGGYDYSLSVDLTDDVLTDRGKGRLARCCGVAARPSSLGAGAVVLAVLLVFFLVLPKMGEVSTANDDLAAAQAQQRTLESQLAALEQAEAAAPEAKADHPGAWSSRSRRPSTRRDCCC